MTVYLVMIRVSSGIRVIRVFDLQEGLNSWVSLPRAHLSYSSKERSPADITRGERDFPFTQGRVTMETKYGPGVYNNMHSNTHVYRTSTVYQALGNIKID